MTCRRLRYLRITNSLAHGLLQHGFVQMMPVLSSSYAVNIISRRWENPLPRPLSTRVGIFAIQRVGQNNSPQILREITLVLSLAVIKMFDERLFDGSGKHCVTILISLTRAYDDLVI